MPAHRQGQAGVTLVEVLVVLVLVAVAAGAVGLAVGPASRNQSLTQAAQLLAARLNRAADEVLLTGEPMALVWTDAGYHFETLRGETWSAHPVALLASEQGFEGAVRFSDDMSDASRFEVLASLRPALGEVLRVTLESGSAQAELTFDGVTARLMDAGQPG